MTNRTRHTGRTRLTAALQHLKTLTERLRSTDNTRTDDTGVNLRDTQLQHGNGPEARKLDRLKKRAWDAESPVQTRRRS